MPNLIVGLIFFLIASFCNGIVIEVGRKIRTTDQEEEGVDTYSKLWGMLRASFIWWCLLLFTAIFATLAARDVGAELLVGGVLFTTVIGVGLFLLKFKKEQKPKQAKAVEIIAAVWTIILYLSLGIIPGFLK